MAYRGLHKASGLKAASEAGAGSSGKGPGDLAGLLSGRRADPMAYRRVFRDKWGDFLRANFHSPVHVAVFFDTDEKTARQWWNDVNQPSGWAVAFARECIPGAAAALKVAA